MKSHSEISGSTATCTSPELYAACHILLHLSKPSHPPNSFGPILCMVSMNMKVGINTFSSLGTVWSHTALHILRKMIVIFYDFVNDNEYKNNLDFIGIIEHSNMI